METGNNHELLHHEVNCNSAKPDEMLAFVSIGAMSV